LETTGGVLLGEHNGLKRYDLKFNAFNLNEIRHLLDRPKTSHSTALWEVGLRGNLEQKKKPIRRNKEFRTKLQKVTGM